MKRSFTLFAFALFSLMVLLPFQSGAQVPDRMNYQAVVRNSDNELVTGQTIGMQITILRSLTEDNAIYIETQAPVSNANGLVSIEIGGEDATILLGSFMEIDWSDGPYFIKTEMDPSGGTDYTITGISQLLSVPYALHARTAGILTGEISESQISDLQSYLINEEDPVFSSWDKSTGIEITESQISDLKEYLLSEEDPTWRGSADQTGSIRRTGNVGIGLSSTPTQTLDINGQVRIRGGNPGAGKVLTSNESGVASWETVSGGTALPEGNNDGEILYWDQNQWVTLMPGEDGEILTFVDGAPVWEPNHGNIEGSVKTKDGQGNLLPLAGATVTLKGTPLSTITNTSGEYTLTGIPLGTQFITVSNPGYAQLQKILGVRKGVNTLNFTFETTGTIQGIVRTPSGSGLVPVAGAQITLSGTPIGTMSGFDGTFTLSVPLGHQIIVVSQVGFTTQYNQIEVVPGSNYLSIIL